MRQSPETSQGAVGNSPSGGPRFFYGWVIVAAGFLTDMGAFGISWYSFGVFFKPMLTEFGWARASTAFALTFYSIMYGVLGVIMGRLTDRYGPRVTVFIGGLSMGLGLVLSSQIHAIWQLYLFTFLQGVGLGSIMVPVASTVSRWFVARRGFALALTVSGTAVGNIIMPPLANFFILGWGWRRSYLVMGLLCWAVVLSAALLLRRDPQTMGLQPYGMPQTGGAPAGAQVGGQKAQHDEGFAVSEVLRTPTFWMLFFLYLAWGTAFVMPLIHIAAYATDLGFSASVGALTLSLIGVGSLIGRVGMGMFADKLGIKRGLVLTLMLQIVFMLAFAVSRNVPALYATGFFYGLALGCCIPFIMMATPALFGVTAAGAIFGVAYFGSCFGQAIGPPLAGYVFDVTGGYARAFMIGAGILLVGAILALLLRSPQKRLRSGNVPVERR